MSAQTSPLPSIVDDLRDGEASLAEWAAEHSGVDALDSPAPHVTVYSRHGTNVIEIVDAERFQEAPRRIKSTPKLLTVESLVEYVHRFPTQPAVLYVSPTEIVAVIDESTDGSPRWREHQASVTIAMHPMFKLLSENCLKPLKQDAFAELVEDLGPAWVSPDAATMMEIAQTITIAGDRKLSSAITLANGSISLAYQSNETVAAGTKGDLTVPSRLTLRLHVYTGSETTQDISVRLRTRRRDSAVEFILRPDESIDQIVTKALKSIRVELLATLPASVPVLFGHP